MHESNISPLARRLAEENNVYWQHLMGTGPEGKVVEKDVIEYLHRVMAGDEAINSTPEPLPDGLTQWPQENLANLVVPGQDGQEQYGGEMQTSWQNDAITDLENLEEDLNPADPSTARVEGHSNDIHKQSVETSFSGQDDLDDSLLLNDGTSPEIDLDSGNAIGQVSGGQVAGGQVAGAAAGAVGAVGTGAAAMAANALHNDNDLEVANEAVTPPVELIDGTDVSLFGSDQDGGANSINDDVSARFEQPINTTGFDLDSDAIDYLDDDFLDDGVALDSPDESLTNFGSSLDSSFDSSANTESVNNEAVANNDTIGTLFYDETTVNESAFDAELDDLLFENPDTGFEEPKATVENTALTVNDVNEPPVEQTFGAVDQSVSQLDDQLNDLDLDADLDAGFSDDFGLSDDFGVSDDLGSLDNVSAGEENLGFDDFEEEVLGLEPQQPNLQVNDTFAAIDQAAINPAAINPAESNMQVSEDLQDATAASVNSEVNEFADLFEDNIVDNEVNNPVDSAVETIDSQNTQAAVDEELTTEDFDEILADVDSIDFDSSDTFGIESSVPEVTAAPVITDPVTATPLSKSSSEANVESRLSDFDIADTDFGSAEELLDDQNFATRDGIANSFNLDDASEQLDEGLDDTHVDEILNDSFDIDGSLSSVDNFAVVDSSPSADEQSANIAEDLLATTTEEVEPSAEDKALADAFLFLEDDDYDDSDSAFPTDIQVESADSIETVQASDLASVQTFDADLSETSASTSLENEIQEVVNAPVEENNLVENNFGDAEVDDIFAEPAVLEDFDLDGIADLDDDLDVTADAGSDASLEGIANDGAEAAESSVVESSVFESSVVDSASDFDGFDDLDAITDTESEALLNAVNEPVSDINDDFLSELETSSLDSDLEANFETVEELEELDSLDAVVSEAVDTNESEDNTDNIDNEIDRRFEEALDTAAEQADPYSPSTSDFGDDDIFSDSEGLSFSESVEGVGPDLDPTLTWSDVDMDEEDPLVELERELTSELSEDLDFLNENDDSSSHSATAAGVAGIGATALGTSAASFTNNKQGTSQTTDENWAILEEILEDDADDIRAEQEGDVQLNAESADASSAQVEDNLLDDFDLENSLNELEEELKAGDKTIDPFADVRAEVEDDLDSDTRSITAEKVQIDESVETSQGSVSEALLNQMVDDSSVIDDVTASALLAEASKSLEKVETEVEAIAQEPVKSVMSAKSTMPTLDPKATQTLRLQNYQVARRYVELSNLLEANKSIAQELMTFDGDTNTDTLEPVVLLTRAAAKAMRDFPLGSDSKQLLVSKFTQEGSVYLAVNDVLDSSIGDLATEVASKEDSESANDSVWFTSQNPDYKTHLANSHVVVADLSAFQLDELVTSQQKPVLALGRIVQENDSYVSTLSLSGDIDLKSASEFLGRVAFLLSDPIRLLV